ncbi:MAG: hypothetical protein A3G33_02025 [Omnitrophica bacterium RIFCSPLOWO2_12_FULL_44_17]|uniref:DUF1570 domain-containing protein n=1 Tax=Candidatus Danuiimicrobium aquiferis TaxID=1801832 RepID=A0A1G1KT26_9BACT|nr:MAG: hypothetical protein A3B72_04135 [Omnitrophica bacterium RIFCSPHIGHO2_02_FULL_45_28]OGW96114.1 MAG: hypothetical protein A3G33_02025 [Omnitrophica bacterium RIFCSPLOWO2_12_FULL_44_17]OGX04662.1 MAG: hypothetical protein A3J12_11495 [Omnitrophica bacterium RIFCSPLOWO2_02_FULL_44_11]
MTWCWEQRRQKKGNMQMSNTAYDILRKKGTGSDSVKSEPVPFFRLVLLCTFVLFTLSGCDRIPFLNKNLQKSAPKTVTAETPTSPVPVTPLVVDRLTLKNGGIVEGKLVEEYRGKIRMQLKDGIVGFSKSEIQDIERNILQGNVVAEKSGIYLPNREKEADDDWPTGAEQVLVLKNGEKIGGHIVKKEGDSIEVRQKLEEGGSVVLTLDMDRIEKFFLWKPASEIRESLKVFQESHPGFEFRHKGLYQILASEKDPVELKLYLKSLDLFYQDFVRNFFDLIDLTKQPEALDVIIFGTRKEFDDMLTELNIHIRSNPIGFYEFKAKKLVFYNAKTDRDIMAALSQNKGFQVQMAGMMKNLTAGSQMGEVDRAATQAEKTELRILSEARNRTGKVIRHEGAHQLFHLFGITPFEIYQGGWLIEGLAVYCETDPIGDPHEERLIQLKYELEKSELLPLEYIMNFDRGIGLHELDPKYANLTYAESWVFIYFLLHSEYRDRFLNFIREIRKQGPEYDVKAEKALLEKNLAKSLKEIEPTFFSFTKQLIEDNVDSKRYEEYRMRFVKAS